ncbi:hypothetical protein V8D89_001910 [Ganoderma adspersum]
MQGGEDQLPPKRRLPRAFRTCVGNDIKARSYCPINGTRFDGQVKRKAEVEAEALCFEADQDHGDEGTGSKRKKAKGEEKSSLSGTPPPVFPDAPTVLHPSTTQPAVPAAPDASVQEGTYYHTWSIHDPPSTPAVAVAQHSPTVPKCVISQPPLRKPSVSTMPHGQHAVGTHEFVFHVGSQPPHATTTAPSSGPSATDAKGNNGAESAFPITPVPEMERGGRSTSSLLSPSPQSTDVSVASLSPRVVSELSAAQEDQDSVDLFNAVYQSFFIPRSFDSRRSSTQGPAPVPSRHYADTPRPINGERAPPGFSRASAATGNTVSTTAGQGAAGRDLRDACQPSGATQLESGDSIKRWYSPTDVAHADAERSADIGRLSDVGYVYQLQSTVPESAYMAMYPVPPTVHSSYSELAGATTPRAMGSAVPAVAFYTKPSHKGVGINSSNQFPSPYDTEKGAWSARMNPHHASRRTRTTASTRSRKPHPSQEDKLTESSSSF